MTEVDLAEHPVRTLNQLLHDSPSGCWQVLHPDGRHCIAAGVDAPLEIGIEGHVGYYCAGMNKHANVIVNTGGARAEDVLGLMVEGWSRVRARFADAASTACGQRASGGARAAP